MAKVLLFSTSTCSWCRRAKRYFKEQRVPFKEVNIERDSDAAREIVGFDRELIERELARKAS